MANQLNVNRYRMCIHTSLDTAAKLRTLVKGKMVASTSVNGKKVRKEFRSMTVGDFLERKADEAVAGMHADVDSLRWMRKQLEKNVEIRRKSDEKVRSGAYRKPRSEWLKPGRKPGKKYSSYPSKKKTQKAD